VLSLYVVADLDSEHGMKLVREALSSIVCFSSSYNTTVYNELTGRQFTDTGVFRP